MGVRVEEGQRQKKGLSHKNSYGRITIYLLQRDNLSYLLFLLIEKEYGQECKKEWSKGILHQSIFELLNFLDHEYCKVASSNTSHLEAHAGFFRLLMKGIFDPYVL